MAIEFSCATCHKTPTLKEGERDGKIGSLRLCGKCYKVSYCSERCQHLDWKLHKVFCKKVESQEEAEQRRRRCLETIRAEPNFITHTLFHYFFRKKNGFVIVRPETRTFQYLPPTKHEELTEVTKVNIDKDTWMYIHATLTMTHLDKSIIVLYCERDGGAAYIVGSSELKTHYEQISRIPNRVIEMSLGHSYEYINDMFFFRDFLNAFPQQLDGNLDEDEQVRQLRDYFTKKSPETKTLLQKIEAIALSEGCLVREFKVK